MYRCNIPRVQTGEYGERQFVRTLDGGGREWAGGYVRGWGGGGGSRGGTNGQGQYTHYNNTTYGSNLLGRERHYDRESCKKYILVKQIKANTS
jgi:hypothetical protein